MVVAEIKKALPGIPGVTPGKAHPEHRARRKQYEKEHPHFNMTEFGMKAGVLALLGTLAIYPWEKKYDEHQARVHPERFEKRKQSGERHRSEEHRKRSSIDGMVSERGERRRDSGRERDRGRRRSIGEDYDRYEHEDEGRMPPDRQRSVGLERSVPRSSLRLAVADGYEYVPANREYIDRPRRSAEDYDIRVYEDDYRFRPGRAGDERRRR